MPNTFQCNSQRMLESINFNGLVITPNTPIVSDFFNQVVCNRNPPRFNVMTDWAPYANWKAGQAIEFQDQRKTIVSAILVNLAQGPYSSDRADIDAKGYFILDKIKGTGIKASSF